MDWSAIFAEALGYPTFLDTYARPDQRSRWDAMHGRVRLTETQKELLGGFTRRMPVVVLNGAWCGDCINQCPIFDHFATATSTIELKFLDRDARDDVKAHLTVNGGHRVPVVVFLSEDMQEVSRYGDRTISRYRQLAAEQLGPMCPTGIVPPDDDATAAVVADWLREFERVQLLLRISPRLRERHSD